MRHLAAVFAASLLILPGSLLGKGADPVGPLNTPEEFFSELDYTVPELAAVGQAFDAGDLSGASEAFLDYMRSRRTVTYFVNHHEKPDKKIIGYDTSVADDICKHIFHGGISEWYPPHELGEEIDWEASPFGDREWYWGINRHQHWSILADTYWAVQNEKYAGEYVAQLIDWITKRPVVTDGSHNSSASWRTIETGIRLSGAWPYAYQKFLGSPSFTSQANLLFWMSVVDQARHLKKNPTAGNWLTMEMNGLLHAGILIPEFRESEEWRSMAIDTLSRELDAQVYPDGTQFELSTGYHRVCIHNFLQALELCELNGVAMPAQYAALLEKLYEAEMYITRPSGYLPALNDSDERIESIPESGKWSDVRSDLLSAADRYDRLDMRYVATHGKEGKPPQHTSHQFPYGGLHVMRGDWAPESHYLIFDAGPFGAGHQHEDKLSFEAYAFGETLLFDTGRDSYSHPVYRPYIISSAAHNTVLIDGQGQARAHQPPEDREWIVSQPVDNTWISTDGFDYAEGIYDEGYGPKRDASVTHRRGILFVKDDYWVVVDYIDGRGWHTVNTLFHFAPGVVSADKHTLAVRSSNTDRPNILISPAQVRKTDVSIISGSESPCQGWISTEYNKRVAAPVADYQYMGMLPAQSAYLMMPSPASSTPAGSIRQVDLAVEGRAAPNNASAFEVKLDSGDTDYIIIAPDVGGQKLFAGITTDAHIAIVRTDNQGTILKTSAYKASYIKRGLQEVRITGKRK